MLVEVELEERRGKIKKSLSNETSLRKLGE